MESDVFVGVFGGSKHTLRSQNSPDPDASQISDFLLSKRVHPILMSKSLTLLIAIQRDNDAAASASCVLNPKNQQLSRKNSVFCCLMQDQTFRHQSMQ